jgi:hypothetical protein
MEKVKRIPITAAKEIAKLGYDEVIIVGCQYEDGIQHVTTYGKSQAACENAALGGNVIKKLLKWPEDKCKAKPTRQWKREKYEAMEKVLKGFVSAVENPDENDSLNLARLVGLSVLARNIVGGEKGEAIDKYKN